MIKTKIIATLGPASDSDAVIGSLLDNGVDIFRLNFSHGTEQSHGQLLKTIRRVASQRDTIVGVMGDLCGPKIRTGEIASDTQTVMRGDEVTIRRERSIGTGHDFASNYPDLVELVRPGDLLLIDDGRIRLRVETQNHDSIICQVEHGGRISSHKGINIPQSSVPIPAMTETDWQWVRWAVEQELDLLALSFVQQAEDIEQLRETLACYHAPIQVVAKIEKPQAIKQIERIIAAADAILVARGDLGIEMELTEVPLIQKRLTALCRQYGKPCIVATQMLQSMIDSPAPTRAEVSDVANAVLDLCDAVMLSGETAVGRFPQESVAWMERIAKTTEAFLDRHSEHRPAVSTTDELLLTAAIARSVAEMIDSIHAKLVVIWSENGHEARLFSKARIDVPIVAFSSNPRVCRQMSLHYGVIPILRAIPEGLGRFQTLAKTTIREHNWATSGEQVVMITGRPLSDTAGNSIMVVTL